MRVAHVLRKYDPREWGGTESAVRELLIGLRKSKTDSVVYAPKLEVSGSPQQDVFHHDGFDVRRFHAFLPMIGASDADRRRLVAVGGNLMSFDIPLRLLLEPSLDVIHTHTLNRLGALARLVARQRRIPLLATVHGGYLDLPQAAAENLAAPTRSGVDYGKLCGALIRSRHVLRDADAVITVNPREAELLRAKFPTQRVEVIPHGVPTARYARDCRDEAMQFLPAIRGRTVLLLVSRIDSVKNQGFLVDAMPEIMKRVPKALLVLVGPVTETMHDRYVRSRIRELGLENIVLLPGQLAPDDPRLIGLYQSARVFVLPSLSETFGLVLLEAWASGCAVIASATSGAKQVIREGENGYLFQTGDVQSLLDALERTLTSEEHRKTLIAAGKRMTTRQFDTLMLARRVRDLYAELRDEVRYKKPSRLMHQGAGA